MTIESALETKRNKMQMDSYRTKPLVDRVSSSKMLITTSLGQSKTNSHKVQVNTFAYQVVICFSKHSTHKQMQFEAGHIE